MGDRQEQAAGGVEHVREPFAHVDGVLVEEQGADRELVGVEGNGEVLPGGRVEPDFAGALIAGIAATV